MNILLNGIESDSLAVADRAVQYGDGLFETIRIRQGRPVLWQQHIARLLKGCQRLKIAPPDEQLLFSEACKLVDGEEQAVLKIIYSRGEGGRGYDFDEDMQATRILIKHPWPHDRFAALEHGVRLRVSETRLSHNPLLAGIKHLNRLEQVLARAEWRDKEAIYESIMLDYNDRVIECTMSNIFIVTNGMVSTPDLRHCGVEGVVRQLILEQAGVTGISVNVRDIGMKDIATADEVFISNSLTGILPVNRVVDRVMTSWPVTQKLMTGLESKLD